MTNIAPQISTQRRRRADAVMLSAEYWDEIDQPQLPRSNYLHNDVRETALKVAVLRIRHMPRALRSRVELAMVECIPSPSAIVCPEEDVLQAHWCTQWSKTPFSLGDLNCQEVISGTSEELANLRNEITSLATHYNFDAELRELQDEA